MVTGGVGAFVQIALQSLESPDRIWASLYQYDNLIDFTTSENVEIIARTKGYDFAAHENADLFERSLINAIDKISIQIKKQHDKAIGR